MRTAVELRQRDPQNSAVLGVGTALELRKTTCGISYVYMDNRVSTDSSTLGVLHRSICRLPVRAIACIAPLTPFSMLRYTLRNYPARRGLGQMPRRIHGYRTAAVDVLYLQLDITPSVRCLSILYEARVTLDPRLLKRGTNI